MDSSKKMDVSEKEVYLLYCEISDFDRSLIGVYGDKNYALQVLAKKCETATENEHFYLNTQNLPVTLEYGVSERVVVDGVSYAVKMPKSDAAKFLEETYGREA